MRHIIFLFITVITLPTFLQAQSSVNYFLPKKNLYVKVPFKITNTKVYLIDGTTGKRVDDPIKNISTYIVDGDVVIESKMTSDKMYPLDLSRLGKGWSGYNFDITFDDKGNGSISKVNASHTPATAEIIKGTVSILSSVVKIIGSALSGNQGAGEQQKTEQEQSEQKFIMVKEIEIKDEQALEFDVRPEFTDAGIVSNPKPFVHIKLTRISSAASNEHAQNSVTSSSNNSSIVLQYKVPAEYSIVAIVMNNQFLKEQEVIHERILIPQAGTLTNLEIPILKNKKTVKVGFDENSGNLTEYSIAKESQVGDNLAAVSNGVESLNAEITNLRNEIKDKKEKGEEKAEAQKEAAVNKDIKDEIARLQLEKDRLDLKKEKQDLIAAIKTAQDEMNAAQSPNKTKPKK